MCALLHTYRLCVFVTYREDKGLNEYIIFGAHKAMADVSLADELLGL